MTNSQMTNSQMTNSKMSDSMVTGSKKMKNLKDKATSICSGFKAKTFMGLGALLSLSLVIMGTVAYLQGAGLAKKEALQTTKVEIGAEADLIFQNVVSATKDLRVVAGTPPVQGIIRAIDNEDMDPESLSTVGDWAARMEKILTALLANHPEYYQIRYIGEKGGEIVRVEADAKGIVRAVSSDALQNKSQYDYFSNTMNLAAGDIYYSKVNLNREEGVIQLPHSPVFRIATPVTDKTGRTRGIVIINMSADYLFKSVGSDEGVTKYLANSDGYFIVHPDKSYTYGFDLGFEYKLSDLVPTAGEEFISDSTAIFHDRAEKHIHAYKKVFFDPMDKGRYWMLFYEVPDQVILGDIQSMRDTMLLVGVIVSALSVLLVVWFVSHNVVRPVTKLAEAARRMEGGDLKVKVDTKGQKDEIGCLTETFNYMAARLFEDRLEQDQYLEILKWNSSEREKKAVELEELNSSLSMAHSELEEKNTKLEESIREIKDANKALNDTRAQMVQSERMASVGQLAAGVAHELNNPLMGIMGFTQILLETSDEVTMEHVKPRLEKILHESERTAKIVQSLLTFARAKKCETSSGDINEIVRNTLALREASVDFSEVSLTLDLDDSLPASMVDKFQIQQVFVNIILNALDSINEKGGDKSLHVSTALKDNTIIISFKDSGTGLKDGAETQVFEPFYTTKPVGKGTGLGLSISHGIIKEHGGSLDICSVDGGGALVTISIPFREELSVGESVVDSSSS